MYMNKAIEETRAHIAYIGGMLFDRHLTDSCGGNISVRVDDLICLTPSLAGQVHQWQITASDVLVVDHERKIIAGEGNLSREVNVHFGLHEEFGEQGTAVIHAHPRNLMVFVAMGKSMPPVLEANLKFGEVPAIEYAPAHSTELALNVAGGIRPQAARIRKQAAGVIAPWHGLFLMGKDLDAAFDAVERFDTNAYCMMMAAQAFGTQLDGQALAEAAVKHGKA
jgi:L-fuculose-phosphate aldolase